MPFVRAYPRETQEMVFDAHDRAFAFYKGTCTRGMYDNMKTAVDAIFVRKERAGEFHREAQHGGRMMYPSVSKRRTVLPCQDTATSRPRREIGSPV